MILAALDLIHQSSTPNNSLIMSNRMSPPATPDSSYSGPERSFIVMVDSEALMNKLSGVGTLQEYIKGYGQHSKRVVTDSDGNTVLLNFYFPGIEQSQELLRDLVGTLNAVDVLFTIDIIPYTTYGVNPEKFEVVTSASNISDLDIISAAEIGRGKPLKSYLHH